MPVSRRKFIGNAFRGAVLLSAGNLLQAYDATAYGLPPARKVKLRFAIASDGHYGQPKTEFAAMHQQMLQWLNAEKSGRGLDFSCINGDLYHNDVTVVPDLKKHWDQLNMTYYVSHGNHDHGPETDWEKTWGHPWHFGFTNKDTGFIVLNTADETGKYVSPDAEKTKALLEEYKTQQQLFVFMHITPIKWTDNANPCPDIVDMFKSQQNLKAVFHGHDHDQDGYKEQDGKHYIFDSHIGGSWGTPYRGYRIVEVLKNGDILTYQMNPETNVQVNSKQIS